MKTTNRSLLFVIALLISTAANAAGSALRIACDGDAAGAEVYINGKFKGECPLDMKVPEGKLKLRVQKTVDAQHEPRLFEQEIRMGDGVMKKVEVQLSPLELNAEGKRREEELALQAFNIIEADMIAIPGKNYAMGKYEVTQWQWKAVMGGNPSGFGNCGNNCPVENVSWDDIQIFLQKLNARTGKQYRLPTGPEWEYACYGGSQSEYCGGGNLDAVGWYGENSGGTPHPVGQKQANGYGLYDMSGNVYEWMQDCMGSGTCSFRNQRGGSWRSVAYGARADYTMDFQGHGDRRDLIGFRVARTLP